MSKQSTIDTKHSFDNRDKQLPLLKNSYLNLDNTEARARYIELTEKTRNKSGLGVIYGEKEKEHLKSFLQDVVSIPPAQSDWKEIPDTILSKAIEKHTTTEFNPRNFLSNGYNNTKEGKDSAFGGFLFFGEHNIKNAQALLDYLNAN